MGKIKMALLLMDHLCKPWFESYWITSPDPYLHHASVPEMAVCYYCEEKFPQITIKAQSHYENQGTSKEELPLI